MPPTGAPVIVPLDGSKNAENAVPLALLYARLHDAPARFIHVIDEEAIESTAADIEKARRVFSEYVELLVARFDADFAGATADVVAGPPADAILRLSDESLAVAMASHGRGGFRSAFIGSVTDKVVRNARVPVLVIPGVGGPATAPEAILVPLDGSAVAEAALEPARSIASALGARLVLMRACSLVHPVGFEYGFYPGYSADVSEAIEAAAQEYLDRVAIEGEQKALYQGEPASAIVEAAARADAGLVVMTARGRGLAARLVLGSTTDRVLHSLHRPLLIVRDEGEAGGTR